MNYHLLFQLTRRDIISRNKGSALGNAWSILTSVGTLAMYTFVFTQVFAAKWPRGNQENSFVYALQIYAGLILFNFVSDMLSRAPTLVTDHSNLIQKVVFPSEILPLVSLGSALYFFSINTAILNVASMLVLGEWHVWSLLGPLMIFPLALTTLGLTYFVSALAVFIRDVRQLVGLALPLLMFLSPIFYSGSATTGLFKDFLSFNPLAVAIESSRSVYFENSLPAWSLMLGQLLLGLSLVVAGRLVFMRLKKGFADAF